MSFLGEENFSHEDKQKVGVIICNLGSPDSYSTKDVRKYLREFLSDKRVIEVPKIIWWLVLNLFILPFRPRKSAALYKSVWLEEGSPLLVYSKRFLSKIKNLNENSEYLEFELAMRYGNPSLEKALLSLKEKNCRKILLLPLFPQYSAVTAATIFDKVSAILSKWRWVPSLHFVSGYHDNSEYINSLANTIKTHEYYGKQDKVVFSYHGIPKKYFDNGDPYHCYCQKTSRLLSEKFTQIPIITTFQSRFGPQEWLQPYTDKTLENLPKEGKKNILVICPGFSSDCVEALEEISIQGKESFYKSGGKNFDVVPCLNDSDDHINLLEKLTKRIL